MLFDFDALLNGRAEIERTACSSISGLKPLKNLDYRREIRLGFASLFSWISFPPDLRNPSAALGRARRSFVDVERLRVELARKLDVSSAETSIPP